MVVLILVGFEVFFIKNENFKLNQDIATLIAKIACYQNQLPQGSPCSPVISNLITHSLDIRIASMAKRNSCTYSRYADDITISTREEIFPKRIVFVDNNKYIFGKRLRSEIDRSGFVINEKKTRVQFKDSRQDVTGLVVNKKPNIRKEYWRTIRAQCFSLFKNGYFTINLNGVSMHGSVDQLEGQLNFIDQVDYYNRLRQKPPLNPHYESKRVDKNKWHLLNGREKTFSDFLFYRFFYSSDLPVILTEGKTDNIYLKAAISRLGKDYPRFVSLKNSNDSGELLLRFINYSSRTKFLLELDGGADFLLGFIRKYEERYSKYKSKVSNCPVIILVDNDEGPTGIVNFLSKNKSVKIFPSTLNLKDEIRRADFLHITENLYFVMTPHRDGAESNIEDFFIDFDRMRKFNGRCFNTRESRGEFDLTKDSFANNIVLARKNEIEFDGFRKILDRILMVLEHYDSIKNKV